jgi:hypothetical protein
MSNKVETLTTALIADQTGCPEEEHEGLDEIEIIFSTVHDIGTEVRPCPWTMSAPLFCSLTHVDVAAAQGISRCKQIRSITLIDTG